MKLVRRVHLYSGLFLLPWVLLYGITALLFNHPTTFSVWTSARFAKPDADSDPFGQLLAPDLLAEEVVRALEQTIAEETGAEPPDFEVARDRVIRFDGEFIVEAESETAQHRVRIDPEIGNGMLVSRTLDTVIGENESDDDTAEPDAEPLSFTRAGIAVDTPYLETLVTDAGRVLSNRGLEHDSIGLRFSPVLRFDMFAHDSRWHVRYEPDGGVVSGVELLEPTPGIGLRDFLLELHLAHEYPTNVGARWWWGLVVDAMFVAMVFWGASGVLMWIQIKSVRWKGLAFLAASTAFTVFVLVLMYRELSFAFA